MSKAVLKELQKRVSAAEEAAKAPKFDLSLHLFNKQGDFIFDTARFKTAVCSRRSGKSEACVADLISTCITEARVNCLYITLARTSAKRIIWPIIKRVIKDYQIPIKKIDNSELSIEFENESMLYCSGAKDTSEAEKFRGMSLKKVYIDECQSFRAYIKDLVDDVIVPALWDVSGSLCLIGTPGPVPAGFFYDCSHNPAWANHKWTIFDNPWIKIKSGKEPREILAEERARKGITEADASYQREALGNWIQDDDALVFKFSKDINRGVPESGSKMIYIFGIDIGWHDADAIAVMGYNFKDNKVYLVEEHIKSKQTISQLMKVLDTLKTKYDPVKMVIDSGGLGKKIHEELRPRYGEHFEIADKARKHEFIELMNDDLRTGKFKSFTGSRFEEDCYLVTWDRENPEKPKISDTYHSDACDSTLYAWRECRHYYKNEPVVVHAPNTDAYMEKLEEEEAEKMEMKKQGGENWGVDEEELVGLYDSDWTDSFD